MTKLSRPAQKKLQEIRQAENYIPVNRKFSKRGYVQELLDAGLIEEKMRIVAVAPCYVPVNTQDFQYEKYPND